jgi:D-beta-D-heptose 7-phosphate kinase/D-beta-D-heptose 1-phosphate adenosyltransferase
MKKQRAIDLPGNTKAKSKIKAKTKTPARRPALGAAAVANAAAAGSSAQLGALIEKLGQARVLVLGDVMLDRFVFGTVERMSPEAPIPVLRLDGERAMAGGAANVARNLAALGARSTMIGLVGRDAAGLELQALLGAEPNMNVRLVADPSRPTTEKTRYVADRQQLLRTDRERAGPPSAPVDKALQAEFVRALADVDIVVLSDYAKGVFMPPLLQSVIASAKSAGKIVVADPKSTDFGRYRGADLLTPNRQELAGAWHQPLIDEAALVAAARNLAARSGIGAILVTRGAEGMSLIEAPKGKDGGSKVGGVVAHFRTEAREVFDVSGAGDTVIAVLAAALGAGGDRAQAAALANLAGGVAVAKRGTAVVHQADLLGALHAQAVLATEAKVVARESALERVLRWRARGQRIGFTNGCFDLIHPGHVALLSQARAACDRLVVGLNSDASVRRLKGASRPVQNETARAIVLASLSPVDLVVVFDDDKPLDLIRLLKPDALIKGADYRADQVVGADIVKSYGGRVVRVEVVPGHSTTGTIAKLTG